MNESSLSIGMLLFPELTQLDLTGPYEVFARAPDTSVHLIWKTLDAVKSDRGMGILPTCTFDTCPALDVICIPGGPGQIKLMDDDETLSFIRTKSENAKLVTSVCTGSLVLGAAGLLRGYKATTHWASLDQLRLLGAEPVNERVVRDRNRITGAGVTSGIDFALNVIADIYGAEIAQSIQLHMEYDPEPPFTSGSPRVAPEEILEQAKKQIAPFIEKRRLATEAAGRQLLKNP
ncbi:thiamine biosynthesis protein ThiJ [Rahnella sp. AA]|uniref:DJ-1/PfpI family protein n=1 Tax=Rahnella sp. AA TaxID=2057180 RepID=UPI000C32091E|nr:DJ-1/PfpI family protein [Rahnella sp. AA]PKE32896.1 thiamine biosynthesis protein ThiJ [Rahnella sp. AA]